MNNKAMIVAAVGLLLAGAGALEAAQGRHGGKHDGKGLHGKMGKRAVQHMRNKLSEKLDLSAEQEKKVETILKAKAEEVKKVMEEAREKGRAIRESGAAEIRKLLDKEQTAKFDRMKSRKERRMAERKKRWSKRWERRQGDDSDEKDDD